MLKIPVFDNLKRILAKWVLAAVLICLVLSIGIAAVYRFVFLSKPVSAKAGESIIITVKPGMNAKEIGRKLQDKGLIRSLAVFQIASKIKRLDNSLKAGEYSLHSGMPLQEIIAIISEGRTTFQRFTVPEGYTVEQIAALLNEKKYRRRQQV